MDKTVRLERLRRKMSEHHISQYELAASARTYQPNISMVLNGHMYLGEKRLARMEAAVDRIIRLRLDPSLCHLPDTSKPVEPRVRSL